MKENYTLEEQSIIDQAQATGTYLKAPNGEDTNLTSEQWVYVRTAAFKRWFGDWQDNPDNASKILDKKGEPEVIYHSTNEGMLRAFDKVVESSRNNSYYGNGFYFNYGNGELSKGEAEYYGTGVLEAFANIRNPFYFSMLTHYNGTDISSAGSSSLCFLYNMAKLFPELEGKIEFLSTGHYEGDYYIPDLSYSFSDYIELVDHIGNNLTYTTGQDMDDNPVKIAVFHTGQYDEWTDHEGNSHSYEITKIVSQYHIDTPDDILKNEAIFDSLSEVYNLVADLHPEGYMDRYLEITEAISNRGYDGILESEYGDELVVLSINQVKSASLNTGKYLESEADIRFRKGNEKSEAPENTRRRKRQGFQVNRETQLTVDEAYQLERDRFMNADSMNEYAAVMKRNDSWRGAVDEFHKLAQQSRDAAEDWKNREYKANKTVVTPTERTRYSDEYARKTTIGTANERRRLDNIMSLENKAKEYEELANTLCNRIGVPKEILPENNNIRFRVEDNYIQEEQSIIDQAKANGTYLKAPNGEDTNLTPEQWVQVRTVAFKEWFGDWENNSEDASKAIDENREPMVVYHGSPNDFKVFDYGKIQTTRRAGFYFTRNKDLAMNYQKGGELIEAFVNLRKPLNPDETKKEITKELFVEIANKAGIERDLHTLYDVADSDIDLVSFLISANNDIKAINNALYTVTKYDGIITEDRGVGRSYIAFSPNQIKSALENVGTFSLDNDDIRYRFIGEKGAANLDRAEEATYRLDNLFVAKEMEFVGKDALSIKIATGWERGADDKWRYEDRDLNIQSEYVGKYKDNQTGSNTPGYYMHNQISSGSVGRLSDFISDDNLFIAYPEIADWEVKMLSPRVDSRGFVIDEMIALSNDYFSGVYEILNSEDIAMAKAKVPELYERIPYEIRDEALDLLDAFGFDHDRMSNVTYKNMVERYPVIEDWIKAIDDIPFRKQGEFLGYRLNDIAKGVLSHEIQHAIQHIEGFAHGGSPEEFKDTRLEVIRDINFFTDGDFLKGSAITDANSIREALGKKNPFLNSTIAEIYGDKLQKVAVKYGYNDLSHLIDSYESLPSALEQYRKLSGEVEARNVQSRIGMSLEERRNSLAKLTEDVRREDQIFIKNTFSASMHPSRAEFISAIEDLANSIHIPVDIIGDIDELSDSVAKRKIEAGYNIKGWFIPETNNVAIYLPNIFGVEDAQRTVFHEVVAHYGLRMMFGDHFDIFLDNVYNNATSEIQGKIMYATHGDPAKRLVATEEYLAKLVERGFHNKEEISFWKKAKFAFIDMLRQAGVKLGFKLHDNDLRGILWKSYQNLCQKDASVWRDEQGKGIVEKSNVTSLLSTDKEFKSAVEKNEYIKLCQLKESGYVPSKNVMQSLNSISGKALVAVQKIFGLNSMGDSLAEVETLQGWLCDRKVPLPFMKDKNDYFIV
ncbi:ADP-ribosyltransferase-containing protein [Bacteroides thetaiotaomicron]|jgi:hypothetical protein|uniref:ADP-ribosyltransferase-containing protein n=2 Tax=Bacteroides thetaiotaomicron TaxID=818 RepID=UPI00101D61A9|nr:LPD23 domain-containing protein [Bacteroides thetaiotaomicron]